ncbi:MAG TPA: hypothetical protein VKV03_19855 [Candidatus Binataceae bacterium]|nr:hypothetical protein [Candidatus Binataceae bacterium]
MTASALFVLGYSGIALAQSFELGSIFDIDPTVALNGFALLSGAIVLLFESYRSRP